MSEKSNLAQFKKDIKLLGGSESIIPYFKDKINLDVMVPDRICYCCGAGFIGTKSWNAHMKTKGHIDETITWNLKNIMAFDFVKEDEWPTLNKDRMFIRLHGETMDALISWEDT